MNKDKSNVYAVVLAYQISDIKRHETIHRLYQITKVPKLNLPHLKSTGVAYTSRLYKYCSQVTLSFNTFLLNTPMVLACGSKAVGSSIVMVMIISLIKKPY